MDTRSKSNKKISLLIVTVIISLFAAGFMALYPNFEKKADLYYRNALQGDDFLQELCWSNYVFYKDVMEKAQETRFGYEDLYLSIKEETVAEDGSRMNDGVYDVDIITIADNVRNNVASFLSGRESEAMYEVAQSMDYCVIDEVTGQVIKNTGRPLELLAQKGDSDGKEELPYIYYIMMTYDRAGNQERIAVKDKNSDELLKRVQRVMKNTSLENHFGFHSNSGTGEQGDFYGYDNNGMLRKVTCSVGAPKNATFIYAMTQEQMNKITGVVKDSGVVPFNYRWDEYYAYFQAGVIETYVVLLLILGVVIFILMNTKRYCLHRTKAAAIPMEISILAGLLLLGVGGEPLVNLMSYTNRGYFPLLYTKYLPYVPSEIYPALTGAVNFIILFLLFGAWVYCVNTFGMVTELGIPGFLKERSILVRTGLKARKFLKKKWKDFKQEILHVDLGKETKNTVRKVVIVNFIVLAIMCSMWVFGWVTLFIYSVFLYFALKKYISKLQEQYGKLLEATGSIAEGNLNTVFDEDLGVFESYKEELYQIQEGFRKAVDEEVKSQRMKTELITNVSHDLKTPLTAITTYIELLKTENITEQQRQEYIAVLEKKSLRLKTLIEDLFEVSKANSRNVTMNLVEVDICNLMRQVYLEYEDRIEDADLIFRFRMPQEKIILRLDSQKTYRIFENLYTNIIKYAMPHTRVYVDVEKEGERTVIELKNMSATELHVVADELTERFVRGDSSRNTEGSGLGLAIAKSFAELQGGKMEVIVDGDLFKVVLIF